MTQQRFRLDRTPPPPVLVPDLDPSQQAVVDHESGPLLVLAGPGTGKTTTLVEAVVDRVERRGLDPSQVLVLTFSRKAADELRERITARLGRTVQEPSAYTFHAWCYALVRAWDIAPGAEPPRLLSGAERDVRVHELLVGNAEGQGTTHWPNDLAPALRLRGFAREVADLLDRARERNLDATELKAAGEANNRPAWVSAGDFLDEYLTVLGDRGELDYAGLVRRAVELLGQQEVAADVLGRYQAVFVDEYQDTDPAQEQLLQLLAGGGRDLVAVGDPDQSIYAFRGADVRGILEFPRRFSTRDGNDAPTLALRRSRRSGAELLTATRRVARGIGASGALVPRLAEHRDLEPAGPDATPPEVRLFPTVADEVTAIADLLRRAHLEQGMPWREMAVLVRSGVRSLPVLRRAFVTAGVPVSVAADEVVIATDPAVAPMLCALEVAQHGWAKLDLESTPLLLLSPLGRALPSGLRALGRRLRGAERAAGAAIPRPSAHVIRDAVVDPREVQLLDDWIAEPVVRLHKLLAVAQDAVKAGQSPEEVLWGLWDGSGWGRRLAGVVMRGGDAAHAADRDLDAVLALFDAAARLEDRRPRAGVAALLDELRAQQIPAAPHEERPGMAGSVRLLTAHRSKGLEWDLVVVAGVQDGVWPDLRRRGSLLDADRVGRVPGDDGPALLTDERRLFYVACTRARHRLVVTAVQSVDDAGERPSRFLGELLGDAELPTAELAGTRLLAVQSLVARLRRAVQDPAATAGLRAAAAAQLAALAATRGAGDAQLVPAADPDSWWGLLDLTLGAHPVRPVDEPVRLSGSGVANFDRCSLRWFLEHEVHAQGASSASQGFGTVVHALAQAVSDGDLPADVDALDAALDHVWEQLAFEAPWQKDRDRVAAREVLARFLRWHAQDPRDVVATEQGFDVVVGGARLRGAIDRLERDADGALHVVDLKTGKYPPAEKDLPTEPQLGVYQVAARAGAFGEASLGGAELVQLRHEVKKTTLPKVQRQEPIGATDSWADDLIAGVVEAVRDERFAARPGDHCMKCPFRSSCPAHDAGRQVLPWPT